MSIDKATEHSRGFVSYGSLYLSNNLSDDANRDIIGKIERLKKYLQEADTYAEKLHLWHETGIPVSQIWIGDTSSIVEKPNSLAYTGSVKPEPDLLLSINPATHSEIIDFNLKNIQLHINQTGSFEEYKLRYIQHMSNHKDSALYDRKLIIDLESTEQEIYTYGYTGIVYGLSVRDWYDTFTSGNDTLNKKDYLILDLNIPLTEPPLLSHTTKPEPPYLLNIIDSPESIAKASVAYTLHKKIPFLRKLREERLKIALKEDAKEHQFDDDTRNKRNSDIELDEMVPKKSKKQGHRFTTKQQMILLNALGFLDASIIKHMYNNHKAAVLAQLLNRSVQEIRSMLTYWNGIGVPKDYDCSHPDDFEKVADFLAKNNLHI